MLVNFFGKASAPSNDPDGGRPGPTPNSTPSDERRERIIPCKDRVRSAGFGEKPAKRLRPRPRPGENSNGAEIIQLSSVANAGAIGVTCLWSLRNKRFDPQSGEVDTSCESQPPSPVD